MNWPILILCVFAGWAMLRLLAGDRAERVAKIENRLYAEAQSALHEQQQQAKHAGIPSVGGPVAGKSSN